MENLEQSQQQILTKIEQNIYREIGDTIYIGGVKMEGDLKESLRKDAELIATSRLFEILDATITDEVFKSLLSSKDWDNVQFGKALHHWNYVLKNIINKLGKNKS